MIPSEKSVKWPYLRKVNIGSGNGLVLPRQQAITWMNIDLVLCHSMVNPDHNETTISPIIDQELLLVMFKGF